MRKHLPQVHPRIAVAYLRTSTDEQHLSPEAQRAWIQTWALREDTRVAAWCEDRGVSSVAPVEDRPALREALTALGKVGAGVLVVARRDRLARNVVIAAEVERAVSHEGARVVSATGEGNGDSPADAFLRTVIDGAAQYERGLIRARTLAALAVKRARGERVGAVPYGFALEADGVRLVAAKQEQATIARARELRARGLSLRDVASKLASEGRVSRRGRRFVAIQIARMLPAGLPSVTASEYIGPCGAPTAHRRGPRNRTAAKGRASGNPRSSSSRYRGKRSFSLA